MNHFLLLGSATTPALLDGTFVSTDSNAVVRIVTLTLRQEVKSFSGLVLVDATGKALIPLKIAGDDPTHKIWKSDVSASGAYTFLKGVPATLGVVASMRGRSEGQSSELLDVSDFRLDVQDVPSGTSHQLLPTDKHYPYQITAQSRITQVRNALDWNGTLQSGLRRQVASFSFSGAIAPGTQIKLEELDFNVIASGLKLSNWKVGSSSVLEQDDCSVDAGQPNMVSCTQLPDTLSVVGAAPLTLSLFADVTVGSGAVLPSLQVQLNQPGTVGVNGAIHWSDGAGHFNWIEGTAPIAASTKWNVTH